MKRSVIKSSVAAAMIAVAMIAAASCSSSKNTQTDTAVQKNDVQLYAEDPEAKSLRAWGCYNGFPMHNLEQIAATEARAELSRMVSALATSSVTKFVENKECDRELTSDDLIAEKITLVSSNLLIGSRIVKSQRYSHADGTHTVYVCVEMAPAALAATLQKQEEIIELFNDNEETAAQFKSDDFVETVDKCFDEFRAKKIAGE